MLLKESFLDDYLGYPHINLLSSSLANWYGLRVGMGIFLIEKETLLEGYVPWIV